MRVDSLTMDHTGAREPRGTRLPWLFPAVITAFGLALRLYRLNYQSVWYDEIFSLAVSHQSLAKMLQLLVKDFVQPPFHYLVLHIWFELVGFGPYQGRLLSVILGMLAIVATFCLADYMFDRRTAGIAALLVAVSQLGVMYSQEARPYAQLLFLLPCCSYLFLVALRTNRAAPWWGFVCLATLLAYTHYYAFFAIPCFLLFAFRYRKRYQISTARWIGAAVLAFALYLPWLTSGFISEWHHSSKSLSHGPTRTNLPWWGVLTALNTFNNGRPAGVLESSPSWTFLAGGLLFGVPILIALKPLVAKSPASPEHQVVRENLWLLLMLFAIPFSAGLGVGFKSGAYNIRYITFATIPYYVLVAHGMSSLNREALTATAATACVAYSLYSLHANYVVPYKEDYRDAYAFLAQSRQPADCYIVAQPWEERQAHWAWTIYHTSEPDLLLASLNEIASGQKRCPRVWLMSVMYRSNPVAVEKGVEARDMLERQYVRTETKRYFWVDLDLYLPKNQSGVQIK